MIHRETNRQVDYTYIIFFLLDKTRRDTSLSVRDIITCTCNSSPANFNKG